MKTLHDGTEVSLNTPTKLVNGKRYLLTQEEIDARKAETAASELASLPDYISKLSQETMDAGTTYTHATHGELRVGTKRDDILLINGAVSRAVLQNDLTAEHQYFEPKGPNYTVTNQDFINIGLAQAAHIQKVGNAKGAVQAKIDDGTYTTKEQVKTAFEAALNEQA